tara:strand:- start:16470 stop:17192 length:723 start_codon:yes stop_codon:yes gene_type:complete
LFSIIGLATSILFSYYFIRLFNIKYRRSGNLYDYNKTTHEVLNKYGNYPVSNVYLVKKRMHKIFDVLLDLLSRYRWTTYNKEPFYHVSVLVEITLPNKMKKNILIEKNEGVYILPYYQIDDDHEMIHIAQYDGVGNKITNSSIKSNKIKESATTCKSKILTITDIMKRTRKRMGDPYFFNWDMNKNNCQYFVIHILKSLKIYTKQHKQFIYQSFRPAFSGLNKYVIAKIVDMRSFIYKLW